jgi:predicted dehydrogenase
MARFRWGILGTGAVARKFALGLRIAEHEAGVTAIASRSLEKARQVGQALAISGIYGSYEEAVQNADVDAFYIATPPSTHRDLALLCLKARRSVLVEKPFALDAGQARDIIEAARASGVFCMEAMWTRFLPLIREAKRRIDEGAFGDIHTLIGSFGAAEAPGPENNLFSAALGGGALLDRGVYPISLAFLFLGKPDQISGETVIGPSGVDEEAAVTFRYKSGALAVLTASLRTQLANDLIVAGCRARMHIRAPIYRPFKMIVTPVHPRAGGSVMPPSRREAMKENHWIHQAYQRLKGLSVLRPGAGGQLFPYAGNGYNEEAREVMACIRAGARESAIMPLDESLSVMAAIDAVRRP